MEAFDLFAAAAAEKALRKPQVRNFDFRSGAQHKIRRFDVAVDDVFLRGRKARRCFA